MNAGNWNNRYVAVPTAELYYTSFMPGCTDAGAMDTKTPYAAINRIYETGYANLRRRKIWAHGRRMEQLNDKFRLANSEAFMLDLTGNLDSGL